MDEEIAYIQSQMNAGKPQEKEWNPEEVELKSEKDQIKFEDFDKVEIRVAEVKEVEKVEGSDCSVSVLMLVTVKTVKSSQVSLNSIQTNKNWSARNFKSWRTLNHVR